MKQIIAYKYNIYIYTLVSVVPLSAAEPSLSRFWRAAQRHPGHIPGYPRPPHC
jgi:hypothetical protein